MRFFKGLRRNYLSEIRIKKYLLYALGEIILVTIGILLAIKLNNLNEASDLAQQHYEICERVFTDIDNNLIEAKMIIAQYRELEPLYVEVINGKSKNKHFDEQKAFLITGLNTYEFDVTGVEQIKRSNNNDITMLELMRTYETAKSDFGNYNKLIVDDARENLKHWRDNYPWFKEYAAGKLTQDAIVYFSTSPEYQSRVAYFHLMLYQGYVYALENFVEKLEEWSQINRVQPRE